jgi:hypothetical protein
MPEVAQSRKRLDSVRSGTANYPGFPRQRADISVRIFATGGRARRHRDSGAQTSRAGEGIISRARSFLAWPISRVGDEALLNEDI